MCITLSLVVTGGHVWQIQDAVMSGCHHTSYVQLSMMFDIGAEAEATSRRSPAPAGSVRGFQNWVVLSFVTVLLLRHFFE